jgi:SAM-dependent methyltransferase
VGSGVVGYASDPMPLTTTSAVPLLDGRSLAALGGGLVGALDPGAPAGHYDRHVSVYDRLVTRRRYNRAVWGVDVDDVVAFAREAVHTATGPLLDAGCGTAVFTAAAYRETERPLVLVDRSRGMLERASHRLGDAAAPVTLVQADLRDLPFVPGAFATVCSFAVLHVLDDPWAGLAALRAQLAPGGELFASMIVSDHARLGGAYLRLLRRRGEVGPPRTAAELGAAARELFGDLASVERKGAMAYLRAMAPRARRA